MKAEIKGLCIEHLSAWNNEHAEGFRIEWSANVGWGQCDIFRLKSAGENEWQCDTESMSSNKDRTFLKMLLDKLADTVEVTG